MGYALAGSRVLVISGVDCRCRGDGLEQARSPGALRLLRRRSSRRQMLCDFRPCTVLGKMTAPPSRVTDGCSRRGERSKGKSRRTASSEPIAKRAGT